MNAYLDLLMYFSIYSFLGWVMETVFASLKEKKLVNRGFLSGFFCPIYGFGAILIIQSSKLIGAAVEDYSASLITNILLSIFLVTLLEFITGALLEKIFNCKWWDYSSNAANIKGYICIKYSILWGLLAFLLVQVVHPAVVQVVAVIPSVTKGFMAVLFLSYVIIDTGKSVIDALSLRKVILNYSGLSINKYYQKVIKYKRFFIAFPNLLILNAGLVNHDIRSIINDRMDKIKTELKSRFQQL
ncbi:putative membrane protein [Ruminiclostridium sufflavum DSM 19573]|uniref:Putative membrane protein n=1 Tax=Ruminiclostridium sufflavum DSM 19573 TaxID=1121337 RepID=A0A318XI80_9FIRM|nr:hypothetical protein [Ruminiclostridium sufflavum]PYG86895.1 putative membrane protein [Ruminiclostridium sufflavum DSM 19573]